MRLTFSGGGLRWRKGSAPVENAVPEIEIGVCALLRKQRKKTADVGEDPLERQLSRRAGNLRAKLVRRFGMRRIIRHSHIALEAVEHGRKPEIGDRLALRHWISGKFGRVHDHRRAFESAQQPLQLVGGGIKTGSPIEIDILLLGRFPRAPYADVVNIKKALELDVFSA